MSDPSKRCVLYTRVSTKKQANTEKKFGLELQRKTCEEMAMIKNWIVVDKYVDDGISGTVIPAARSEMRRLIEDARVKKFDIIIVYSLDRLSRKTKVLLDMIDFFEYIGVSIMECMENIDTRDPREKAKIFYISSMVELENDNLLSKLEDGRNVAKMNTGMVGGKIPYGYQKVNKVISINESEARIVRYIYAQKFKGCKTVNITKELNKSNITSPKGKKWLDGTTFKLLQKKERYLGGKMYEGNANWPKIIDEKYRDHTFTRKYKPKTAKSVEVERHDIDAGMKKKGINLSFYDTTQPIQKGCYDKNR